MNQYIHAITKKYLTGVLILASFFIAQSTFAVGVPSVQTQPPVVSVIVSPNSYVTFSGFYTANGDATDVWFDWGTTPLLGSVTPTQHKGATTNGQFSASVTVPSGTQTVYVRAFAINSFGPVNGSTLSVPVSTNIPTATLSLQTQPVSAITATTATFSGVVQTSTQNTNAWFEYGTSRTNLTQVTATQSGVTGTVTAVASGLTPGTTYYVRIVAMNGLSRGTQGAILPFTTNVVPPQTVTAPSVTTNLATNSGQNAENLSGSVIVNGAAVTRWFEYGTTSGSLTSTATLSGTQSYDGQFTLYVSGLQSGTQYYYRACAQNSAGTNCGSQNQFTTDSAYYNGGSGGGYHPNNNGYYPSTTNYQQNTTANYTSTTQCNDGIDNDRDGKIDQNDSGCADSRDTSEGGDVSTATTRTVYVSDVTTAHRASSTTAMYGSAKALVMLALDSTNSTGAQGDLVAYKVSYRNMSGKRLYNTEIAITLPNDLAIERLPNGGGATDDQHFTIDLGTVFTGEEKTITFDAKIVSRFQRNNLHRGEAKMTYVFADTAKGTVTAYENDSIDFFTNNGLGGLALFSGGTGFLPSTFLGWILLAILLYVIVFLFMRFMKERKPKV